MLGGNETEAGYRPALVQGKAHKFVVLSGCSGAGKSSLLSELGRRGFPIYEEPGRQVVKEQLYIGGDALPWGNVSQFLELTISRSIHHMVTAARRHLMACFRRAAPGPQRLSPVLSINRCTGSLPRSCSRPCNVLPRRLMVGWSGAARARPRS